MWRFRSLGWVTILLQSLCRFLRIVSHFPYLPATRNLLQYLQCNPRLLSSLFILTKLYPMQPSPPPLTISASSPRKATENIRNLVPRGFVVASSHNNAIRGAFYCLELLAVWLRRRRPPTTRGDGWSMSRGQVYSKPQVSSPLTWFD